MLKYLIQKSEIGAGTRGSSLGPMAIRLAAAADETPLFRNQSVEEIPNENSALFEVDSTPHAKRIDQVVKVYQQHSDVIYRNMDMGNTLVILSADHASAGATIAGIRMAHPEKRLGVIWIDAHADLHSPFTTPSGNVHGMPLAISLAKDNLAMQRNNPSEQCCESWEELKNTGGISPKLNPTDLVFIGVRDAEREEAYIMNEDRIVNHKVSDVRAAGAVETAHKSLEYLSECDLIYVSFDVDSMDPSMVSHGTGTPVKDGLSAKEAELILTTLLKDERANCVEFVEVNPLLDEKKNYMAETALLLVEASVNVLENK
mgnify:CR=1 FL=1